MTKKLSSLLLIAAAMFGVSASQAHANMNISASICQSDDLDQTTDIDFYQAGIANVSSSKSHNVWCAVPRSPVEGDNASFWVDGYNPSGRKTYCGLTSYNYTGDVLSTVSMVMSNAGNYDKRVDVPSAQASTWAYVTVNCELPPGGKLYGVITK